MLSDNNIQITKSIVLAKFENYLQATYGVHEITSKMVINNNNKQLMEPLFKYVWKDVIAYDLIRWEKYCAGIDRLECVLSSHADLGYTKYLREKISIVFYPCMIMFYDGDKLKNIKEIIIGNIYDHRIFFAQKFNIYAKKILESFILLKNTILVDDIIYIIFNKYIFY